MYIEEDICYAENAGMGVKILAAKAQADKKLLITFSTGEKRIFDPARLQGSAFLPLANEEIALHPTIFHGVLTWDEGNIDIAPETVYEESTPLLVNS